MVVQVYLVKQYDHPFLIEDTPGIDFENSVPALREGMLQTVQVSIEQADLGK